MNHFKLFSETDTTDARQVPSLNDHIANSQVLEMTLSTRRLCLLVLYASQAKQSTLNQHFKTKDNSALFLGANQRQLSIIPEC